MPRYKNTTNSSIFLEFDKVVLKPGEEATVYHFYNIPGLKLLDIKPYKSPFKICEYVTITSSDVKEYDVLDSSFTIVSLDQITIHLNEYPSEKTITMIPGASYSFQNVENTIYKLYITTPLDNSSFYIAIFNPDVVNF